MLTTAKPIIVSVDEIPEAYYNHYIEYRVSSKFNTNSTGGTATKLLYVGKTFVDSYGHSEVHIERLLRDYLFKWKPRFDANSQATKPEVLAGSLATEIRSIEAARDQFFNTKIIVEFVYNEIQEVEISVVGSWSPSFQKMNTIVGSLDEDAIVNYVQNYATIASKVLPHLPPAITANFWLGLVLNINQAAEGSVGRIGIGATSANVVPINYTHGGTYAVAYPISAICEALSSATIDGGEANTITWYDEIDGGDSDDIYDGNYDGGSSDDSDFATIGALAGATLSIYWDVNGTVHSLPIAVIDECPADYYISWITPTGGWTSFGFGGNVVHQENVKPTQILNLRDERETIEVAATESYNLYTGLVDRETYDHLVTMIYSPVVYVYDSKLNEGHYCNIDSKSASTLASKTGKAKPFNIQLQSITDIAQ